jgi:hypothetical protein
MTVLPPPNAPIAPAAAPPARADTAAALLFDGPREAEAAIDGSSYPMQSKGGKKVSEIARKVARREIRRALIEMLDIKLGGVVLRAWQGHGALLAAAQRTTTGGREVVLMAEHTVTSKHSPHVDLAIDGVDIARISSAIVMSLQIVGVNAVVERGELVGLEGGSIVASTKFSIEDVPIASRSRTIDAVATIRLDHPIRLAGPTAPAAPTR